LKRLETGLYLKATGVKKLAHFDRDYLAVLATRARADLDGRLLNGSDYPLPGVDLLIWTRRLVSLGMISADERKALNKIWKRNPLLFDYVLKRTLKDPKTGRRWEASLFQRSLDQLAQG